MSEQSHNVNPHTVVEYNTTQPGLTIEAGHVNDGEWSGDIIEITTDEDAKRLLDVLNIYLDDRAFGELHG